MTARGTAAVVLALCVSVGIIGGVVLDRLLLIPNHIGRRATPARGPRALWPASQAASRDRLASELALTDSQRVKLDTVLSRQTARFRAAREVIQPQIDSIFQQTRAQIDSILTPQQRDQLRNIRDRNLFGFPPGIGPRPSDSARPRRRGR
jgi:Spy/CpxP family protein refolding chaperone